MQLRKRYVPINAKLQESLISTILKTFKMFKKEDAEKEINLKKDFLLNHIRNPMKKMTNNENITFLEILNIEKNKKDKNEWNLLANDEKKSIENYVKLLDKYLLNKLDKLLNEEKIIYPEDKEKISGFNTEILYKRPDGKKIIVSTHAIERFFDNNRFENINRNEFKNKLIWVTNNAIDKILKSYENYVGENFGVHSISTGIGLIINWRPDYKDNEDKTPQAIIVSILPIKRFHNFKSNDIKLIVEKQIQEKAKELIKEEKCKLRESKNSVDSFKENDLSIVFFEGQLYDYNVYNFILVE